MSRPPPTPPPHGRGFRPTDLLTLVNALPDAVFVKDLAGVYLFANHAAREFTGLGDIVGRSVREIFRPDEAEAMIASDREVVEHRRPITRQYTIRPADGEKRLMEVVKVPILGEDGLPWGVVGISRDITERHEAESRLGESERFLRLILDNIPQTLFWKDRNGVYLGGNRQLLIDTGKTNVVGLTDSDMPWTEDQAAHYTACDQRVMRTGRPDFDIIEESTDAAGRRRWLKTNKIPLRNSEGDVVGVLGSSEDITELKLTQAKLEQARDAAETANRAKSEFLANMSHEIRTPMTAIIGYAEILESGEIDEERKAEFIRVIRRNGEHLLHIINDVLDLSRVEAGRMTIEEDAAPLADLLHDSVFLMRARAEQKGVALGLIYNSPIPETILTDATRFRQILMNMVGNAIKFTEKGSVAVEVELDVKDGVEILAIDVIDTGIGISPQDTDRLFLPFEQADTSSTRMFGGSGLGLAISRRFAELLGGDVRLVESTPGAGSRFRFDLPVQTAGGLRLVAHDSLWTSPSRERPAEDNTLHNLAGRVLLAEDGPDNQRLIAHHLRSFGLKVCLASNGQEAIELTLAAADKAPYNLVLMDMQMPVVDGYQATRSLRELGVETPIVALTAHAMRGDRGRCLDEGCNDYATKPISRTDLHALCARYLPKAAQAA
ncbi:MAG: PAS domain-containing sensor histidine kinase [Phycisphaerales bacterium]|nr:MAG: PAS domain-containing sensor histidine kinase [Phycisphaerales bacterium]